MAASLIRRFFKDESGQAITEYGSVLAFVAILVALVFTLASGGLNTAISNAVSVMIAQMNTLNTAAS